MRRALFLASIVAWTGFVVLVTMAWMLRGQGMQTAVRLFGGSYRVEVSPFNTVARDAESTLVIENHSYPSNQIRAQAASINATDLRVLVDYGESSLGGATTFSIHKSTDGHLTATVEANRHGDFGRPPHRESLNCLEGWVELNSTDWIGTSPLILSFNLHGRYSSGRPWCQHGVVAVPL